MTASKDAVKVDLDDLARCPWCCETFVAREFKTGRPKIYCSTTCRKARSMERTRIASRTEALHHHDESNCARALRAARGAGVPRTVINLAVAKTLLDALSFTDADRAVAFLDEAGVPGTVLATTIALTLRDPSKLEE